MLTRKSGLRSLAVGAVTVSSALVLAACGSDNNSGITSSSGGGSSASAAGGSIKCDGKGNLLASGSTAQKNAMDQWTKDYMQACSGVQINYKGTGSGAGVTEFLQGSTAFAGSDSPLKPEQIAKSASVCKGGQAIDLPLEVDLPAPDLDGILDSAGAPPEGVDALVCAFAGLLAEHSRRPAPPNLPTIREYQRATARMTIDRLAGRTGWD